jgi:hypothetical protein
MNFDATNTANQAADDNTRFDWALPILTGSVDDLAERRALALAMALGTGLAGREAIDVAIAATAPELLAPVAQVRPAPLTRSAPQYTYSVKEGLRQVLLYLSLTAEYAKDRRDEAEYKRVRRLIDAVKAALPAPSADTAKLPLPLTVSAWQCQACTGTVTAGRPHCARCAGSK